MVPIVAHFQGAEVSKYGEYGVWDFPTQTWGGKGCQANGCQIRETSYVSGQEFFHEFSAFF